jgi:phage protein U
LKISGKSMYATAMDRLDDLRALQAQRVPVPLVDGIGRNWGLWQIITVSETQSCVIDDGTAMVVEWFIDLLEFANA